MKKYKEGYELKEDEYLLKIRDGNPKSGFMTKFNKNGTIPFDFIKWGKIGSWQNHTYIESSDLEIFVIKETFRSGWKLNSWRFGKSRNWASLIHPEGFTVEIYLKEFLNIIKDNTIINGEIIGEFKWEYSKLIKKE